MKVAVATFVKTATITPVKTRLAKDVGQENADKFYYGCINAIEQRLLGLKKTCADIDPYWAIAEQDGLANPIWSSFNKILSGEGELGNRLHHVYSSLRIGYDYVLLMGADSPHIPNDIIMRAIDDLASHDCVVGRTHDGGFYLFGSQVPIKQESWTENITYSSDVTADQLIANLRAEGKTIAFLPSFADVDEVSDLPILLDEINQNDSRELSTLKQIIPELHAMKNKQSEEKMMQGA